LLNTVKYKRHPSFFISGKAFTGYICSLND